MTAVILHILLISLVFMTNVHLSLINIFIAIRRYQVSHFYDVLVSPLLHHFFQEVRLSKLVSVNCRKFDTLKRLQTTQFSV